MTAQIHVWSDYVCPFCLIADEVIERAITDRPGVEVVHHAHELRPRPAPTLRPEDPYLPDIWQRAVYPMARRHGVPMRLPTISPQPVTEPAFRGPNGHHRRAHDHHRRPAHRRRRRRERDPPCPERSVCRMTADKTRLEALMAEAVEFSVRHVESGGIPFVGLLVADDGWVSDPGVNLVRETGDPTAHALERSLVPFARYRDLHRSDFTTHP